MLYCLTANNVPILRLSYEMDSAGMTIAPEAHITFPRSIPVNYGKADEHIGGAMLQRVGDVILADLELYTSAKDVAEASRLIRKLYPAVGLRTKDAFGGIIFRARIIELFLTPYRNDDRLIPLIGDKLSEPREVSN